MLSPSLPRRLIALAVKATESLCEIQRESVSPSPKRRRVRHEMALLAAAELQAALS